MNEQAPAGPGQAARRDPAERWFVLGVFAVALAVRLVFLAQSAENPTFARPVVDAGTYHRLARDLAEKRFLGEGFFWQPFLYPFFLAVLYAVSGSSILFAKVVQVVLGGGTCVLTYWLGKRLFGRRGGLIAAGITAFYGPLIFFETELLAAGPAAMWSALLVLLFLRARDRTGRRECFALGLAGALAMITRPVFLPPLVGGCVWLAARVWRDGRRRQIGPGMLAGLAGFLAVAAPLALLAYWQTGRASFLPSSGGINLYIGNNPDVEKTLTVRPGWEWRRLSDEPLRHGCKGLGQQQRYFLRRARDYAASDPAGFAAGLGRKAVQFVSSREIPRNVDIYMFRRWSSLLGVLVWKVGRFGFPFGVLLPVAAAGLALCRRRVPAVLWLFLLLYAASVIVVFVAGRYRVVVIPLFSVLAAGGCVCAVEAVRRRQGRRIALAGACALAAALASALPGPFREEKCNFHAELHLYLGSYHQHEKGDLAYYVEQLSRASELMPENSDAVGELGYLYLDRGDVDRAIQYLNQAVAIEPENFIAHHNLGTALAKQKEFDRAIRHFSIAAEHAPCSEQTQFNLASLFAHQGSPGRAAHHYALTVQVNPRNVKARYALAEALMRLGRDAEAVGHYRKLLELKRDSQAAQAGLAWVLATSADPTVRNGAEAIRLAGRAFQASPNLQTLDTLAAACAEVGRFTEAIQIARQALRLAERKDSKDGTTLARPIRRRLEGYQDNRPYRRLGSGRSGDEGR